MFIKHLVKSLAVTTALGSTVAFAGLAGGTVTASPEIRTVACDSNYPASAASVTELTLAKTFGQFGSTNVARVVVKPSGSGATPTGSVRFRIPSLGRSWTRALSTNGTTMLRLPKYLSARATYEVDARYLGDCTYTGSSDTKYYTVTMAGTRAAWVGGRSSISRGGHPVVRAKFSSETGVTPRGTAVVRIFKNGHLRGSSVVTLNRRGVAAAGFRRVWAAGYWTSTVVFRGSHNFKGSAGHGSFRVTR